MLNQEQIDSYKLRLEKQRDELKSEIDRDSRPVNFGAEADPEDEEADEAEEFGNNLAATPILRERVQRIEEALKRIESGEYGKCQKCGSEITTEVLDLVPESYFCDKCK